eukprot:2858036-Prymnesium_polylepis.2
MVYVWASGADPATRAMIRGDCALVMYYWCHTHREDRCAKAAGCHRHTRRSTTANTRSHAPMHAIIYPY